jgi:hypothetical protein
MQASYQYESSKCKLICSLNDGFYSGLILLSVVTHGTADEETTFSANVIADVSKATSSLLKSSCWLELL